MKLLKIDNKLVVINYTTGGVYDITNNLTSQIIKQIIGDNNRFAILTTLGVYFLHCYDQNNFTLDNLTNKVELTVPISNIKFIVGTNGMHYCSNDIGITTNSNEVFLCKITDNIFKSIGYMFKLENDVIAVSNKWFGYIYKLESNPKKNLQVIFTDTNNSGNKYVVGEYNWDYKNVELCIIDTLPTKFVTPQEFIAGDYQIYYDWINSSYKMDFKDCHKNDNCVITETWPLMDRVGHPHYYMEYIEQLVTIFVYQQKLKFPLSIILNSNHK